MKIVSLMSAASALGLLTLAACSGPATPAAISEDPKPVETAAEPAPAAPDVSQLPAGDYTTDPSHSTLIFHVNHLGFSHFTASFSKFTANLKLDPAHPEAATLVATIDVASLTLPSPPKGFHDELLSPAWLGVATTPQMKFVSTSVKSTGPATADITGDFTLKGVTQPVTLHATFNGGWPGIPQDPHARIGFSAHGALKRSAFGIDQGIPAPGSTMGVSDDVTFEIESEFNGPPMAEPTPAAPTSEP